MRLFLREFKKLVIYGGEKMSDKFGLKIGIEGEKEFKNSIRDINNSFKLLKSEMNLVVSEFSKQENSMSSLSS